MTNKKMIGAGMLAAAAAAGVAGYYFYASKSAGKNRKIAAKWAGELKRDVVKRAEQLKKIDRKSMLAIVDAAARAYEGARSLKATDVAQAARELKDNWQDVAKELNKRSSSAVRAVKGAAKKAKKAVHKATA